jgi:Tol biopolymer transport system component
MKGWRIAAAMTAMLLALPACGDEGGGSAEADTPPSRPDVAPGSAPLERIAFSRNEGGDTLFTYTAATDGTDVRPLFTEQPSEMPRWSPDGSQIQIFCCDEPVAAHLIDPATGSVRTLPLPDPALETHCGFAWSPDGRRLACEVFGIDDEQLNGIYTIRTSDGGGLQRITTNPGGDDTPGDYSPDGARMVFTRSDPKGHAALFVTNVDGTGVRELTNPDRPLIEISPGSWSPAGDKILFAARRSQDHHKTIWVVNADGSSLHELRIEPACGGLWSDLDAIGCYSPTWSPDGEQIAYVRSTPDGVDDGIFIANADGSGSVQVTDGEDDEPDWGAQPAG